MVFLDQKKNHPEKKNRKNIHIQRLVFRAEKYIYERLLALQKNDFLEKY
jgi:hypothetical protein